MARCARRIGRTAIGALVLTALVVDHGARGHAFSLQLPARILAEIEDCDRILGLTPDERAELHALYQPGAYAAIWTDSEGRPSHQAGSALSLIDRAASEALDPGDYHRARIAGLIAALKGPASERQQMLAPFDVTLSSGMLRYVRHLHMGRVDPRAIGFRLTDPADHHDFAALLRTAATDGRLDELVTSLTPPLAQYRALRDMLARYRKLAIDPPVVLPRSAIEAIRPGDAYDGVVPLQRHLVRLGDLPSDTPLPTIEGRYEGPVVDGVKRFQVRHGLESDGVLGRRTLAALQVSLTWRVRQIELALERLRWLPHLGDQRLVVLNIPMFRLWAWDSLPPTGVPALGMDVIVGRAVVTQTPVFHEQMEEVIFRPYWNVPPSILRHEVLPAIRRNPDYLRREDMEIVRGAGDDAQPVAATPENLAALERGALRVRQRPGPKNSLGLIKFVFPNDDDVYMHGTPAMALFSRSRRDFSHGCVRVADPVTLAEWVLKDSGEWDRDRIVGATAASRSTHVRLARPIQVVLFYTTAAVMPEDGTIRFAEDIYGHDVRLDRALARRQTGQ